MNWWQLFFHSWAKEQNSELKIPFRNEGKTNAEKQQVWRDKETVIDGENGLHCIRKLFSSTDFFIHSSYADLKVLFHKISEISTILSPIKCIVRLNQVPEDIWDMVSLKKYLHLFLEFLFIYVCASFITSATVLIW